MTSPGPVLSTRGIAKAFGPVVALRSVDLTVESGEVHALLGANGAGKSTLVKILTGVVREDAGSIDVEGRPVRLGRPADARRHGLAPVFQDPALVPDLTVTQNFQMTGISLRAVRERMGDLGLERLDLDGLVRDLPLPQLRMLDLARALASDPRLLILDEITAALPADLAERVFEVIRRQKAAGRSVLFISHRLGEVRASCDQATILRDGRNVATFPPAESGEERIVKAMMGEAVAAEEAAATERASERAADVPTGPVRLAARDLQLGNRLNGVTLEVRAGEILGLAALEGQGQDALFDVLSGDERPDAGVLELDGEAVTLGSPYDAIRRGVVLVPADRLLALLPQRSVRENLASPLYNRLARWGLIDQRDERRRVESAVSRLAIDIRAQAQVRRLSGGNQQKVTIGRWLTAGFRTLLCYDPTRGIDIGTKRQIYGLLRELAGEGVAVVLYTSELREIPLVCDRVATLYGGRIVDERPAASADEEALLSAAHGLPRSQVA
jgi:ribose transport system ATP-binding protein